jgi:DNA-binding MarR family transcriptional regulator
VLSPEQRDTGGWMMTRDTTLIEIQRVFERGAGVETFTGEYEVVCCLLDGGWLTPLQLQRQVRISAAALRYTLATMLARGVVDQRSNPSDGRSAQYRLTDQMRALVLEQYVGYLKLAKAAIATGRHAEVPLNTYHSYISKGRQVSHLTAEFQILLYLYVAAGLGNHEISHFIDVSPAKFNQSLGKLRALGLIEISPNPADRRSKLYNLTQTVRAELDRLHDRVGEWLSVRNRHPGRTQGCPG